MKVLKFFYYTTMALFFSWFILSWFEIGFHNTDPNYTYDSMNLINLMMGWMG